MIDAKKLDKLIEWVNEDDKAIHTAVKKVNKQPDSLQVRVLYIPPNTDAATFTISMYWRVSRIIGGFSNCWLREKWFDYVASRMAMYAARMEWEVFIYPKKNPFEFGIGYDVLPFDAAPLEWHGGSRTPDDLYLYARKTFAIAEMDAIAKEQMQDVLDRLEFIQINGQEPE